MVLPDIARWIGGAVEIERVEQPVLEHDPIPAWECRPVDDWRLGVGCVGACVAVERCRPVNAFAQALVVVSGDEIRVREIAVDRLGLEALVRVENEDWRVAAQKNGRGGCRR